MQALFFYLSCKTISSLDGRQLLLLDFQISLLLFRSLMHIHIPALLINQNKILILFREPICIESFSSY